ncbi:MAG: hypothetical protein FJ356_06145 [Thaumarchaeota archaeon]|nr:hypothetical protein [Nitrososphaerota archaeon]
MSPILDSIGSVKAYGWGKVLALTSFESIATITATSGATSLTFSSISQTYDHLQIRGISQRNATNVGFFGLRFNSDTSSSNYSYHSTYTDGSSASTTKVGTGSYGEARGPTIPGNSIANDYGPVIVDILGYSSTSKVKTLRSLGGFTYNGTAYNGHYGKVDIVSNLWNSTSAISSITIYLGGDEFSAGSTYALYGIKGS